MVNSTTTTSRKSNLTKGKPSQKLEHNQRAFTASSCPCILNTESNFTKEDPLQKVVIAAVARSHIFSMGWLGNLQGDRTQKSEWLKELHYTFAYLWENLNRCCEEITCAKMITKEIQIHKTKKQQNLM